MKKRLRVCGMLLWFFLCGVAIIESWAFPTDGRVVDKDGNPVADAMITYENLDKRLEWTCSDKNGYFGNPTDILHNVNKPVNGAINLRMQASSLHFDVTENKHVTIDLFDISGKLIKRILNQMMGKGHYSIRPFSGISSFLSKKLYIVKVKAGNNVSFLRFTNLFSTSVDAAGIPPKIAKENVAPDKRACATPIDRLRVGKTGYLPAFVDLTSYDQDVGNVPITLRNINASVDSLLNILSKNEKIGQVVQVVFPGTNEVSEHFMGTTFGGGSDGPDSKSASSWANFCNSYYQAALNTPKKIPLLIGLDNVHGCGKCNNATIFPHNIGLGCTWDSALVEKVFRVTAIESQGIGINYPFTPSIAVPRDDRWGRTYEGFAETPDLTCVMAEAAVLGLQGRDLSHPLTVAACVKHFAGDGGTEWGTGQEIVALGIKGIDRGDTKGDEQTLRAIHLAGYETALKYGVASVMVSFSSWNGNTMHNYSELLTKWLKDQKGFDGIVQGDWEGHRDLGGGTSTCLRAGLDLPMATKKYNPGETPRHEEMIADFNQMYNQGYGSYVENAIKRILRIKFRMGLFQNSLVNQNVTDLVGSQAHRDVARESVRKSLVLLKNENNILPLNKNTSITIVGKHGDNMGLLCGGWTLDWQGSAAYNPKGTTIRGGFNKVGNGTINYSENGSSMPDNTVIAVIGEQPYAEMLGDQPNLNLPDDQYKLVTNAKDQGKEVICILITGRPVNVSQIVDKCDALVAAWLPGTEGDGIAEVLYGDYDFTGKLSFSWPRESEKVNYGDSGYNPRYPYEHGLNLKGKLLPGGVYR